MAMHISVNIFDIMTAFLDPLIHQSINFLFLLTESASGSFPILDVLPNASLSD